MSGTILLLPSIRLHGSESHNLSFLPIKIIYSAPIKPNLKLLFYNSKILLQAEKTIRSKQFNVRGTKVQSSSPSHKELRLSFQLEGRNQESFTTNISS